jgi:glycosyltransferase involved in cell wall biosynthesis
VSPNDPRPAPAPQTAEPLKLLIWSVIPTHHQSAFFAALHESGMDVIVHYYSRLDKLRDRLRLGWDDPADLPPRERYVQATPAALQHCPDWRQRIHVIPGYGTTFLLRLALLLSRERVRWVHWGEPSRSTLRSLYSYPIKRFYYGWLVNRYAVGALAIGECARNDFTRLGVQAQRIRLLPYAVPAIEMPTPLDADEVSAVLTSVRFVFLGALCHRKGTDVLLRAFRRVASAFPGAHLELVGSDDSGGEYRELATQLGLAEGVRMTDSVPAALIGSVFSRCDVFVLPSRFDGWGVVLNEAASAGKALISTEATGAAHHLIADGLNGFRVPVADAEALAQAMLTYCRNPELVSSHGRESRRIFKQFTPEQNARRLHEGLESLLRVAGAA